MTECSSRHQGESERGANKTLLFIANTTEDTRHRRSKVGEEHRDACERGMMEKSAVAEVGESPSDRLGGDHSTGPRQRTGIVAEGGTAHPDDTLGGALQPGWRTGSPWLLDRCDEEAGREEQSSPTFDLRCRVSSVVLAINSNVLFAPLSLSP